MLHGHRGRVVEQLLGALDVGVGVLHVGRRHRSIDEVGALARQLFDHRDEIGEKRRLPAAEIDHFEAERSIGRRDDALHDVVDEKI